MVVVREKETERDTEKEKEREREENKKDRATSHCAGNQAFLEGMYIKIEMVVSSDW